MLLNKEEFFNNKEFLHHHANRIREIQFSANGKFLVTISSDSCKLWQRTNSLFSEEIELPFEGEKHETSEDWRFRACVSNDGRNVVAMRGLFQLEVFVINAAEEKFTRKEKINLATEIVSNKQYPGFEYEPRKDIIIDMHFDTDERYVRVHFTKNGTLYCARVSISDGTTTLTKPQAFYDDLGIFAVKPAKEDDPQSQA